MTRGIKIFCAKTKNESEIEKSSDFGRKFGRNPVEKGKKQVQVPIFAGFEQKDVMTRLPYRRDS